MNIKPKVVIPCKVCEKKMRMTVNASKTRRYCSVKCASEDGVYGRKKADDKDKVDYKRREQEIKDIKGYVRGIFAYDEPDIIWR